MYYVFHTYVYAASEPSSMYFSVFKSLLVQESVFQRNVWPQGELISNININWAP